MSQRTSLEPSFHTPPSFSEEKEHAHASKRFSIFPSDYAAVVPAKNYAITAFVIVFLLASMLAVVIGVFALLASQGALPAGLNSLASLAAVGYGNSWCLIVGASALVLLSTWAFIAHQKRQANDAPCPLKRFMAPRDTEETPSAES